MVKVEKTDHHCLKANSDALCGQRDECRAQALKSVNFIGVSDWNTCITLCALFHIRHRLIMPPSSHVVTIDSDFSIMDP